MAGLLERLFKVIQATLHSIVSRFEDPIKLAEQGIRDLKTLLAMVDAGAERIGTSAGIEILKELDKE